MYHKYFSQTIRIDLKANETIIILNISVWELLKKVKGDPRGAPEV